MKKHFPRIRVSVSLLWIPYLLFFSHTALSHTVAYIFLMLGLHELAHVLCAVVFHYPISRIIIYPFGLAAQISFLGYGDVRKEGLILAAGPFTHVFLPLFFQLLVSAGWISSGYASYLCQLNASLMIFNLLPVYPLDGGRLLQAFMHSLFSYKAAQRITFLCSGGVLLLLCFGKLFQGITAGALVVFLFLQLFLSWKGVERDARWFYHYRYLHPCGQRALLHKKDDLYRSRHNLFYRAQGFIEEEAWLREKFFKQR